MKLAIAEKLAGYPDRMPEEIAKIVDRAIRQTGFSGSEEIWRGLVYKKTKPGTVIIKGASEGRPAVLKVQLLPVEHEEADLMRAFEAQSQSTRIRTPHIFSHYPWHENDAQEGYAATVMEYVEGSDLYEPPFADTAARQRYVEFFREFRTNALKKPFLPQDEERTRNSATFLEKRLVSWVLENAKADVARRLDRHTQEDLVTGFSAIVRRLGTTTPMTFTHGHLGPQDVKVVGKQNVLLANQFWSWRPEYYAFGFNTWVELMAMWKTGEITVGDAETIVDEWGAAYKRTPGASDDGNFARGYDFMVLERCIGSVLMDLVVSDRNPEAEERRVEQLVVMAKLARILIRKLA